MAAGEPMRPARSLGFASPDLNLNYCVNAKV